jgi:hypothetical protein
VIIERLGLKKTKSTLHCSSSQLFVVFQTKHFSFLPSSFNNNNTLLLPLPLATVTIYPSVPAPLTHQHIPFRRHQYFVEDCC